MRLTDLKRVVKPIFLTVAFCIYTVLLFQVGLNFGKTKGEVVPQQVEQKTGSIERPTPTENIQSATILASSVKLCANTVHSYEIAYPSNWFSTYNIKDNECFFFAPYTFVVPDYPDNYFVPITVKLIAGDEWESTVESLKNPSDIYNVGIFKNLEINGKAAKYIEAISTGNLQPKGFYKKTYLIFDAQRPVEITYVQQSQDDDINNYSQVLVEMANSLRLF